MKAKSLPKAFNFKL